MKPSPDAVVPAVADLGRVHFIGIGGAGMSAIARILAGRGVTVSGSDARASAALDSLSAAGIAVRVGHEAALVDAVDTVVVSTAVRDANPELVRARERGLPVLHRSQALASLMEGRRAVAVAGTHGKTTTTGMLTTALRVAGVDPSFAIGGELTIGGENARDGSGDVFVAEADESDGSFLVYRPWVAVVTNVEPDHLDHYGTGEAVSAAFAAFVRRVRPGGAVVWCADDPGARAVLTGAADDLRGLGVRSISYGTAPDADVRLEDVLPAGSGVRCLVTDRLPGAGHSATLSLQVPGRHNALNAAAAFAAGLALGVPAAAMLEGLAAFGGTRRRFEPRGEAGGIRVFDDYAHHPTEVAAVLRAARPVAGEGRLVAAFQPHLFSRTRLFAPDFGAALGLADRVVVLDVYPAREDPEPGVDGALVADAVPAATDVTFLPGREDWLPRAVSALLPDLRDGDLVLTVGAGDVTDLGPALLAALADARGSERS